jgi:hypothetical protein
MRPDRRLLYVAVRKDERKNGRQQNKTDHEGKANKQGADETAATKDQEKRKDAQKG